MDSMHACEATDDSGNPIRLPIDGEFTVSLPRGRVRVTKRPLLVRAATGTQVCSITLPRRSVTAWNMKRGLAGTLGGSPLTIDRPYNGLRPRRRVIRMWGDGLCVRSVYRNPVKFSLVRCADDFVVAERRGRDFLLSADATESEWLACVALSWSGVLLSNSIFRGL